MSEEQMISTGEAAELLGCHRTRVDQLIREGKLSAVTLSMPKSYRLKGVKRYVSRRAVETLRQERAAKGHKPKSGRPKREKAGE